MVLISDDYDGFRRLEPGVRLEWQPTQTNMAFGSATRLKCVYPMESLDTPVMVLPPGGSTSTGPHPDSFTAHQEIHQDEHLRDPRAGCGLGDALDS